MRIAAKLRDAHVEPAFRAFGGPSLQGRRLPAPWAVLRLRATRAFAAGPFAASPLATPFMSLQTAEERQSLGCGGPA
jgi:hypothetical protein